MKIHSDINECSTSNGGCADTCTNTAGSYYCTCDTGYSLASNNHGCDGELSIISQVLRVDVRFFQMSMSVAPMMMIAVKFVLTLLVALSVHVMLDMNWTLMEELVLVC